MGWTTDLELRLTLHWTGAGARLLDVLKRAGIGFRLAGTRAGTRKEERRVKNLGSAKRHCPICGIPTRATIWDEPEQEMHYAAM